MNYNEMKVIIQQTQVNDLGSTLDTFRDGDEAITSQTRQGFLRDWIDRNRGAVSANDFATKIIPAIGDVGVSDPSLKKFFETSLTEKFVESNPSTSFEDLKDVILPLFQKSYEKRNALSGWMRSPSNVPDINIFINQFIPVIDGTVSLPLIKDWMGCEAAISTHDLKERIFAIPYSEERSLNNSEKLELAKIFMDRPENKNSSPEEKLATATILFPESNFVSNLKRNWLAKEGRLSFAKWTSQNLNEYGVTLNNLTAILDSTDQYDQGRASLTNSCVTLKIKSANLDAKRLVAEIFPLSDSAYSKRDWASEWMESRSANASLRISDLQDILHSFKDDSSKQASLIKSYWECTTKSFEDLKEVLPELVKNNYPYGFRIDSLIREYETHNDNNLGLEQLKEIVPLVGDKQKLSLVQNWIRDSKNASELNNLRVSPSSLEEYLTCKNEVGSPISAQEMTAAQIIASPDEDHKCLLVLAATELTPFFKQSIPLKLTSGISHNF